MVLTLPNMLNKSAQTAANPETLARLEFLYQAQRERQKMVGLFRDYYDGNHPTLLSERQQQFLHHNRNQHIKFCMNYCRLVVDAPAERLQVRGFEAGDERLSAWLWKIWQLARMDAISKAVHLAAIRDGEAFVIVDYDSRNNSPRFTLNLMDDGQRGMTMRYGVDGNPLYAVKRWTVDEGTDAASVRRMNVYYADRIEKYISTADSPDWQPYQLPGEDWPLPWLNQEGEPPGIPVIHFRNRDRAAGIVAGMSEIHDIIPLQDALNKLLIDLISVADTNAFPLLVALGFSVPDDFSISPGGLIEVPPGMGSQQPDFKTLNGADLQNFIAVLQHVVMEIARVSSTPLSRLQISGQVAAEGTLKQQEAGLIAKVEHKQVIFGNAWEDTLRMAMRIQNVYGVPRVDEQASLSTLWSPAAPRSESEHLQMLLMKRQLGVPEKILLREAGYAPEGS